MIEHLLPPFVYSVFFVTILASTVAQIPSCIHFFRLLAALHRMSPHDAAAQMPPPWRLHVGLIVIFLGLVAGYIGLAIAPRMPFFLVSLVVLVDAISLGAAFAVYLLKLSPLLNVRFAKVWLKALDFPFLALGFVGVARLINSPTLVEQQIAPFDFLAITAIIFSLGIRIAKSIIEVFFPDWH